MITVDLRTAVLEEGQAAYMVHPGKNYHLFGAFLGQHVIAPDMPELSFRDGSNPANARNLDAQINRARALRDWLALPSAERKQTEYDTALGLYVDHKKRRFHDSYIEHMSLILWELPEGTVVFVPNPDLAGKGFFCELEAPTNARKKFRGLREAKRFEYLGRPVRNIQRVPMRLIPPEILESKNRQSIVTELDAELSERIFRLYYGSFSIKGGISQVEIDIPSKVFRPADASVLSGVANLFEDNLQKLERGEVNATVLVDALFLAFNEAELQLHARLNSPGIVQVAARSVTPALLSVLISLAGNVTAQEINAEALARAQGAVDNGLSIKVINTRCADDDTYPRLIEDRLFGILNMMGEDEIRRVCERVEEFRARTNASTDAVLE